MYQVSYYCAVIFKYSNMKLCSARLISNVTTLGSKHGCKIYSTLHEGLQRELIFMHQRHFDIWLDSECQHWPAGLFTSPCNTWQRCAPANHFWPTIVCLFTQQCHIILLSVPFALLSRAPFPPCCSWCVCGMLLLYHTGHWLRCD